MEKPAEVLDRDLEWGWLRGLWESDRPELAFVLGRRRAGKSFLLSRFAQACGGVYYQATRRTEVEQLARLSALIGAHFNEPMLARGSGFPDWESLFQYLTDKTGAEPFVLVLDEFPWLSQSAPALTSLIQSAWDHEWSQTRMRLILSGSHITAMRQLEEVDQPLYGRRTARLDLRPFTCVQAAAFVPSYKALDALRTWGTFGGLPGHLALLDAKRSWRENVESQLLSPGARLLDDAQHMLDAFLGEAQVHYSVLQAIALGDQTWKGITNRVGRTGGALSRVLQWLVDMEVVERVVPITERDPHRAKRVIYRIADPYVAFWHRFVSPLVSAGMVGLAPPPLLFESRIEPHFDGWMGPIFEEACREFVAFQEGLPFPPLRVGRWWDSDSRNEVDVVAEGPDGELFLAECKWGSVGMAELRTLERRAELVLREWGRGAPPVHLALFTGAGAHADLDEAVASGRVLLFRAEEVAGKGG